MSKVWYSFRIHDREYEDDIPTATVMRSVHGPRGPWWDMASGIQDWVEEIVDALTAVEDRKHVICDDDATWMNEEARRG